MGSSVDMSSFTSLLFAVALHKGFTSFSVGSALVAQESKVVFLVGVLIYACAAPTGVVAGVLLTSLTPGAFAAAAQCFAAGTLLAIGLLDMLLPAVSLEDVVQSRWNLSVAFLSATAMTMLAAWV
mmetsp:Transcript_17591/g.44247  ORF Transcript_17591/g.44247 Transcript_17591/m.44247 type:complete len:125 (+) Transcript_17591:235-609(+)